MFASAVKLKVRNLVSPYLKHLFKFIKVLVFHRIYSKYDKIWFKNCILNKIITFIVFFCNYELKYIIRIKFECFNIFVAKWKCNMRALSQNDRQWYNLHILQYSIWNELHTIYNACSCCKAIFLFLQITWKASWSSFSTQTQYGGVTDLHPIQRHSKRYQSRVTIVSITPSRMFIFCKHCCEMGLFYANFTS